MSLASLFSPRAVAVIGASDRKLTIGHRLVENLTAYGFTGPVYPVNPKGGEICGLQAYPSILDTPDPVDVAHIAIKNTWVPACVEDCAKKGVRFAIVNTAGFGEIGPEGVELEGRLLDIAKKTGIRIFGPNCQGVINSDPETKAYCNFTFTFPTPGHISIVAQSGGVGELVAQRIDELGVGIRQYASNGNACDVSIPEIIEHFGADDQTKAIVVHIESLPDPQAFLEIASNITPNKPILAMKVGRTAEGAKAVSSHTGGMVKQDTAIELVFKKAGILAFQNVEELCQSAIGLASQPVPKGNRVGMIANTGGPAIIATDELIERGSVMPALSKRTCEMLDGKLHPEASINNPIDVLATGGPDHFAAAIDALMQDDGIDSIFLNFVTPHFVDTAGLARVISAANGSSTKPIIASILTDKKKWADLLNVVRQSGVPVFDMPDTAAAVLSSMGRYAAILQRPVETAAAFPDVDSAKAGEIVRSALLSKRNWLSAADGFDLLGCYGIPVAKWELVDDVDQCILAAEKIGYPVALKIDAESVVHKSDKGGVVLGIEDSKALQTSATELLDKFADASPKLLVQKQLRGGQEVIIGAKAEPGLGHLVLFGLGGIYVEVLEDVAFALTPVTPLESKELVESIQAYPLLSGIRGQAGVDVAKLSEIIQRVSCMLLDNPKIRELDINPLFASADGVIAADVRVLL